MTARHPVPHRQSPRKMGAFTLIELLVVIAIIAILAAILFPVFAQARGKARQTACLSNIKQLNSALMMYAQDYDEKWPQWKWGESYWNGSGAGAGKNNATSYWACAIYPYVKSAGVYRCPSNNTDFPEFNTTGNHIHDWFKLSGLIGFPQELIRANVTYGINEPLHDSFPSMASIDKPAETLLIADTITGMSGWDGHGDWVAAINSGNPNDPRWKYRIRRVAYPNGGSIPNFWDNVAIRGPWDQRWAAGGRHNAGNNIGFADGHVAFRQVSRCTVDLFGVR